MRVHILLWALTARRQCTWAHICPCTARHASLRRSHDQLEQQVEVADSAQARDSIPASGGVEANARAADVLAWEKAQQV